MSAPEKITLSGLPRGELEALAGRLLADNAALRQAVAELRAEVATLKGVKGRPTVRPSGMEKGTGGGGRGEGRGPRARSRRRRAGAAAPEAARAGGPPSTRSA